MLIFKHPLFFILLLIPLYYTWWSWKNYQKHTPTFKIPVIAGIKSVAATFKGNLKRYLFLLRSVAMTLIVIALARPQTLNEEEDIFSEGIDIMLSIDVSGSMLAQDFEPNRLAAAKDKAANFIKAREHDRVGLVMFSGESITQCPLTSDHNFLQLQLSAMREGILQDGTAIGMGLATAVNNLKSSDARSKVVILLTDGVNNAGLIDPKTATELALEYKVVVYTIGVGQKGYAPYPVQTPFGVQYQQVPVEIDEDLMKKIAEQTSGKYFRATSNQSLADIYKEIDNMEKSKLSVT
ncbi:MAG: vWA domain-containing protein, partial [Bacteroidia bacterium]